MSWLILLRFKEIKGHWPFMKAKPVVGDGQESRHSGSSEAPEANEKTGPTTTAAAT